MCVCEKQKEKKSHILYEESNIYSLYAQQLNPSTLSQFFHQSSLSWMNGFLFLSSKLHVKHIKCSSALTEKQNIWNTTVTSSVWGAERCRGNKPVLFFYRDSSVRRREPEHFEWNWIKSNIWTNWNRTPEGSNPSF